MRNYSGNCIPSRPTVDLNQNLVPSLLKNAKKEEATSDTFNTSSFSVKSLLQREINSPSDSGYSSNSPSPSNDNVSPHNYVKYRELNTSDYTFNHLNASATKFNDKLNSMQAIYFQSIIYHMNAQFLARQALHFQSEAAGKHSCYFPQTNQQHPECHHISIPANIDFRRGHFQRQYAVNPAQQHFLHQHSTKKEQNLKEAAWKSRPTFTPSDSHNPVSSNRVLPNANAKKIKVSCFGNKQNKTTILLSDVPKSFKKR